MPGEHDAPAGYAIRAYRRQDAAALAAVDARASALFAAFGYPSLATGAALTPQAFHALAGTKGTLVAVDRDGAPVGHAVLHPLAGFLHLRELAVDPVHGRRGVGTALLCAAVTRSVQAGHRGVSLTTFRDLPFNERFYARQGFVECALETAPPALARQFHAELPTGISVEKRLLMLRRNKKGLESAAAGP
ncbi:GNAT family N-acetyltransferase [Chelativorans intermedius]|uniref:GNAT family N-acetyltransferase n=1 Tax=Chelativorans intermedius TaxID=515947 RepID=A0ABV6D8F8_9HYPH|nr:GNAT family N-acetyltransferase [Chelativorans intermedius]MCT8998144.1 GNAT family N-acetyltransferase [Chelativorans intermedius]